MSRSILGNEVPIREQRLGSITGYKGTVKDLISRTSSCPLKNSFRNGLLLEGEG